MAIRIGTDEPTAFYIGETSATKIYLGSTLVWEASAGGGGYSDAVLALSPVAYYRLGESSGTTMTDSSGNGRNGTHESADGLGATGLVGDADTCRTYASGRYSYVSDAAAFNITTNLSVVAWVKISSNSSALVTRWDGGVPSQYAWILDANSGKARFVARIGGSNRVAEGSASITDGAVHMLGATYDGSTMRLYVDGSQVATASYSGTIQSTSNEFGVVIGARELNSSTNTFMAGDVDEVAIFDTLLDATDMSTLYAAGTA